jgi:NitT/TauT family transport system ATP-binding protein
MSIELTDVTKTFPLNGNGSRMIALDKVSLTVEPNEFVCLLGPSGCGKSTLLKMIAGFIKPDSGTVVVDGQPVCRPTPTRGMVFQEYALFPWLTVEQNVMFGLTVNKTPRRQAHEVAARFIEMVGLTSFARAYPHQLSGGMKQRVGIARILAMSPEVLLMDEPFGSLDAFTRMEMQEELVNLWKQNLHTTVFVTHDVDEAVYLADRIVVMTNRPGRIKTVIRVPLGRPRTRTDGNFTAIRTRVLEQYERTPAPLEEFII